MKCIAYLIGLFILLVSVLAERDLYEVLGVNRDATEKEIKRAYRQLSKIYHPDKNPNDDKASEKFMEVSNAYDVLSNKEKRDIYDHHGHEGLKHGADPGGNPFGGGGGDPFNMFHQFFGGGGQRAKPKTPDATVELDITLEQFYSGANAEFSSNLQGICSACSGSGSADGKTHKCDVCRGGGRVVQKIQIAPNMFQQVQQACPKCGGKGKIITHKCKSCDGNGVMREMRTFKVDIERGSEPGHKVEFEGEADKAPDMDSGNLIAILQESPDHTMGYRRRGNNLFRREVLSLQEAIMGGWERTLAFFGGQTVKLSRKSGETINDGEKEIIKGYGMPKYHEIEEYGDLIVEYLVIIPKDGKKGFTSQDEL